MPPSKNRYKYALIVQDQFTKFVIIKPLRAADGPKILKVLDESVFSVFGFPKILHTDNATTFVNKFLSKALEERGVKQTTIPPYHAQANPIERVCRTLKTMIFFFYFRSTRQKSA